MTTEDKSQMPLFSPEDEKEAQKVPDHHSTNGTLKVTHKWTGFQGKTLWDWLQLLGVLAIPIVVVGATILFGWWQGQLAQQQHDADQRQALDQQRATILQTYIDNIQELLLNHNLLGDSPMPKNDADNVKIQEVQELARSRTLTALRGLDPERKGLLVQFIYDARLIGFLDNKNKLHDPVIGLYKADISRANLSGAILNDAILLGANLSDANLSDADFSRADLRSVSLSDANLSDANLTQQQLDQVYSCYGAFLPTGLTCHHNQ
jgi:uncharacterized protein YjbI with pentapeptide repeats